ncbi:MAG: hypothetical protein Q8P89_00475 [bacterium]|nr:hypothetical protein [bacterium]
MTLESRPSVTRQVIEAKPTSGRIIGNEETARYLPGLKARQVVFEGRVNNHNHDGNPYAKAEAFYREHAFLLTTPSKLNPQISAEEAEVEALRILGLDVQAAERFAKCGILPQLKDLEAEEIEKLEAGIEVPFINPQIAKLLSSLRSG